MGTFTDFIVAISNIGNDQTVTDDDAIRVGECAAKVIGAQKLSCHYYDWSLCWVGSL